MVSKARKIKKIVSISLAILPIFMLMFLILAIFIVIGGVFGSTAVAEKYYGTDNFQAVNEKGTVAYQNEMKFYDKLQQVSKKYQEKCNEELNINYIYAVLIYYYYNVESLGDVLINDSPVIDYSRMTGMVDTIFNLMYDGKTCFVDYSKNGIFYDNLKNSSSFKSKILKTEDIDSILDNIFDLAYQIDVTGDISSDDFFIPEDTKVSVNNSGINSNGNNNGTSGNNQGGNNGGNSGNNQNGNGNGQGSSTTFPTSVSFKDYILGITYANTQNTDLNITEKLRALVVLHTTNVLAKGNLSINSLTISINDSNNDLLYCNPDYGCSFVLNNGKLTLQVGGGEAGHGNNTFYAGKYYYKLPIDSGVKTNLTKIVNEMYGYVLVTSDNKFNYVDVTKINKVTIEKYSDALKVAYPDLTLKNIRENVYDNGVNFGNVKVSTSVIAYDQNDYGITIFCGRTNPKATIKTSGCGVTAMAILVSSYENSKKYDPVYEMNKAYKWGYCGYGISGTAVAFFQKEAKAMGYKYLKVGKSKTSDKNLVLSHLSSGDLIIVHMGPGKFTSGGHYMVLSGIDPDTKKVYVTDPYNKANKANPNRKSGNGWYSFNDIIAKQAYAFYIIWKG